MSFSAEIFKNKLSVLDDSQDSIVSISQWVLFHHRHSKEAASIWSEFLLNVPASTIKNPSSKRLSLLYLCNDVVQQARRKRREEFISDFAKVLPNALKLTYATVTPPIKPKVERLINVWEERQVFSPEDIRLMKEAIAVAKKNPNLANNLKNKSDSHNIIEQKSPPLADIAPELKSLNELFLKLNKLRDESQTYLTQYGIQSKTYLPHDPALNDALPGPRAYLAKLNTLEKVSHSSINSLIELKQLKTSIQDHLSRLSTFISESVDTDESKLKTINEKLTRLDRVKSDLRDMTGDNDEEPSPSFESTAIDSTIDSGESKPASDFDGYNDDDSIPTYDVDDEDDDDEDDNSKYKNESDGDTLTNRKRRLSQTPSGGSTPSSLKRVAFSEDIEVKEYEAEEQTDIIKIVKSDDDTSDFDIYDSDNEDVTEEYTSHHKDDLELKHEYESFDEDEYDPSAINTDLSDSKSSYNGSEDTPDIASILSKLS
ncbi:regulator of Ty1 transposition [Scheffersomyces amazonensis]|uniref:regulator of Ty1 transposition n=1 Tax=Scheffersomyces amazonensis TaxID=1078765 RepID=UPI00315E0076